MPRRADERLEVGGLAHVGTARDAREQQPEHVDVAERVVVLDAVLPRHVAGQVDRSLDRDAGLRHQQVLVGLLARVGLAGVQPSAHDLERSPAALDGAQALLGEPRRPRADGLEVGAVLVDPELARALERCYEPFGVGVTDLAEERQQRCQRVLRGEPAAGAQEVEEADGTDRAGSLGHQPSAFDAAAASATMRADSLRRRVTARFERSSSWPARPRRSSSRPSASAILTAAASGASSRLGSTVARSRST